MVGQAFGDPIPLWNGATLYFDNITDPYVNTYYFGDPKSGFRYVALNIWIDNRRGNSDVMYEEPFNVRSIFIRFQDSKGDVYGRKIPMSSDGSYWIIGRIVKAGDWYRDRIVIEIPLYVTLEELSVRLTSEGRWYNDVFKGMIREDYDYNYQRMRMGY